MITQRFWIKGYDVIGIYAFLLELVQDSLPPTPLRKENSVPTILLVRAHLES